MSSPDTNSSARAQAAWTALNQTQAVIEFSLQGRIIDANRHFLKLMGFQLDEILGHHHSMFCALEDVTSPSYEAFWERLCAGHSESGCYKRFGRDGREVFLRATYSPVLGSDGRPERILKVAQDVTEDRLRAADSASKIVAMNRSHALIEFALDGTILDVNDNALALLGYRHDEVVGWSHSMLCDPVAVDTDEYRDFWQRLAGGTYFVGCYRRIGRAGREVWVQASYDPILDADGHPAKVLLIASDVTAQVRLDRQVRESQVAAERLYNEVRGQTGALQTTLEGFDQIIALINDIAAQTEQLAHHAAIEAGDAGEAARNIAAAAKQVRRLAHISSAA